MKWQIVIESFVMSRRPQTEFIKEVIIAPTAADAITMANLRFRLPFENTNPYQFEWKRISDINYLGHED